MIRILLFTDPDRDYLADQLAHGFVAAGHELIDWPLKESLHWGSREPVFDCDFDLPRHALTEADVRDALAGRRFDLVVIPTLRGDVRQRLLFYQRLDLLVRNADITVAVDGEDHALNTEPAFAQCLGFHPARYFKRELPIGETWARPLPFGYPEERIVPVGEDRANNVVYSAYRWEWCGPDSMRTRLEKALDAVTDAIVTTVTKRVSVAVNHQLNRASQIALSPSGRGFHTNRHAEIVADGCCPVIESPWMQWPGAFVDGVECRYFRDEIQAVELVQDLLHNPADARAMAERAQEALRQRHTTRVRAETVWGSVHG